MWIRIEVRKKKSSLRMCGTLQRGKCLAASYFCGPKLSSAGRQPGMAASSRNCNNGAIYEYEFLARKNTSVPTKSSFVASNGPRSGFGLLNFDSDPHFGQLEGTFKKPPFFTLREVKCSLVALLHILKKRIYTFIHILNQARGNKCV